MDDEYRRCLTAGEQVGLRYRLRPPRGAPAGLAGLHLAAASGSSLEFKEHREYEAGDDLRRIDWGAYARSDRLVVKHYRDEVRPRLDILIDGSRSMALEGSRKAAAALGLAGLLAAAGAQAGYSHRASMLRARAEPVAESAGSPARWDGIDFDHAGCPAGALLESVRLPGGMRALISDLLWSEDPGAVVARLAERAAGVVVVMVLGDADVEPPARGNVRLVDVEAGGTQEIFIDGAAIERYRAALARHRENWYRTARRAGAVIATVIAERFVDDWRLDELAAAGVLAVR